MSEDIADRLRQLAREHSAGRLELADYRRLRAPLLDFLVCRGSRNEPDESGTTRPNYTGSGAPDSSAKSVVPDGTPVNPQAGEVLASASPRSTSSAWIWKLALALLLLLVAVLSGRRLLAAPGRTSPPALGHALPGSGKSLPGASAPYGKFWLLRGEAYPGVFDSPNNTRWTARSDRSTAGEVET